MERRCGIVALVGRPNSGKSSLLNTLLGTSLSIVTPKAQTTRDEVKGILTDTARGQIVFVDTPGLHRARKGQINAAMVRTAEKALEGASLIWYLVAPDSSLEHEMTVIEKLTSAQVPVFVLMNKIDWKVAPKLASEVRGQLKNVKVFNISALQRRTLNDLLKQTWAVLPFGDALFADPDQMSDRSTRYFVGELIRKQLYLQLGQELPYSCAVTVDTFKENAKPWRIEARILTERPSQKQMVIGKGGQKIKALGMAARVEIEEFLERKVFLGLKVEVLPNWTKDPARLKQLGYHLP